MIYNNLNPIVVLGDCQSTGQNCLSHIIYNDPDIIVPWHNVSTVDTAKINWLKKTTSSPISMSNLKVLIDSEIKSSELSCAWPKLINRNIVNLSFNGGHHIGHLYRLKDFIRKNGLPSHVILSEPHLRHRCVVLSHNRKKIIVERGLGYEYLYDPLRQNATVFNIIKKRLDYQSSKDFTWHIRKHVRSFTLLKKFMLQNNIKWTTINFGVPDSIYGNNLFEDIIGPVVDCHDLYVKWATANGEISKVKHQMQFDIASRISSVLEKEIYD